MRLKVEFTAEIPDDVSPEVTPEQAETWILFELVGGMMKVPEGLKGMSIDDVVDRHTLSVEVED